MYRIGEFSTLVKVTVKALRYYEKENLLTPSFIDFNGYRYYDANKINELMKILSLRQLGFSIKEIKKVLDGENFKNVLTVKKANLENELIDTKIKLLKINNLLEGKIMNYEVITKELPNYVVYYKEGIIKNFNEIVSFILSSGEECRALNPNIKCVNPDYCYVSYLDNEYKESDIRIRYAQAVLEEGISNGIIKFEKLKPLNALCIYHKGSYKALREAYAFIMKYVKENGYKIIECPRERYIDGMWNKENEEDWLTEIQVPVEKLS